jgi:hypothetical protein
MGVSFAGNGCKLVQNDFTGGKDSVNIQPQTAAEFNNADTGYIDVAWLDDTHFVVAYQDMGNSSKGTAIIGEIDSSYNITYGSEYVFSSAAIYRLTVCSLDSSHFVVAYRDNSNYGTAIVGVVSNDDQITYGSEYVFNSATTYYPAIAMLNSTSFVVAYQDVGNSNYGTAIVGVVSNDDQITYGSEYVFNSASTTFVSAASFDSTKIVISYRDDGNSNYGTAIIGEISNDDEIAYGSEYVFNEDNSRYEAVISISDTQFVVIYEDYNNSRYGTGNVGSVSGTTISYGSSFIFNEANTSNLAISNIGNDHFVVVYRDEGNSDYGTAIIGTVYGNNYIIFSDEYVYAEVQADYNACDGSIIAYRGTGDDGYAQYLLYGYSSYCIKSDGNNNQISLNQFYGTDGKAIEVAIDSDGNNNDISNNQIYGENAGTILHGINIRDDSVGTNVSSNQITGVEEKAFIIQGTRTKVTNNYGEDNGNLMDRGDCESETAPMVAGETTPDNTNVDTYERSGTQEYAGTYSWKATGDGGGTMTVRLVDSGSELHGLVAGLTYTLSAYVYVPTGGYTVGNVKLFYDDDQVSASYSSAVSADDTWELLTLEFTVDDDATDVDFGLFVDETGTDSVYIDQVRLLPVGVNNEHDQQYVDNGTGTQEASNSWQNAFPA